jgi:hypothetical protein
MLGIPENSFIAHGPRAGQLAQAGIDAEGIAAAARRALPTPRERAASSIEPRVAASVAVTP